MKPNADDSSDLQGLTTLLHAYPLIRYVHYHVVDLAGILRSRVVPIKKCLQMVARKEPKRVGTGSLLGHANVRIDLMPDRYHQGCDVWYPDWSSFRMLDCQSASVLCSVSDEATNWPHRSIDDLYTRCPRASLQKCLDLVTENADISFLIGFELEFYLVEGHDQQTPTINTQIPPTNYWSAACLLRGKANTCLKDCVKALEEAGIELEQYHGEFSPQQFEISLSPMAPVAAVDTMVQAMEIVRQTAEKHQMKAVFHPKPFPEFDTCGLHIHLSIQKMESGLVASTADHFLAGIMQRLLMLCALGMPLGEFWEARFETVGGWIAWGTENRHVPVRAIGIGHWEFRAVDISACPYLVVAAYIAAGFLGLQSAASLNIQDCPDNPNEMKEEDRLALGITTPLPSKTHEAYEALRTDSDGLSSVLGVGVLSHYHAIQEAQLHLEDDVWKSYLLSIY